MSYSNPMHHAPGAHRPGPIRPWRAYTLPDGTRAPTAPPEWPFGTIQTAPMGATPPRPTLADLALDDAPF